MKQRTRTTKKLVSVLLTLVMVLGLLPAMSVTAYAADEVSENISLVNGQSLVLGTHYSVSGWFENESGIHVYNKDPMTINARKGETITKVVLTYSWGNYKSSLSASAGTFDGNATISDINAQQVTISSSDTRGVKISAVTVYFEGSLSNPTVTLTGGANAKSSGGLLTQSYLPGAMDTVTYTALTGAAFPEFETYTQNGVTVERTSDTVVTISGTPTANTEITVPDAESSSKIVTWDSSIINDSGRNGIGYQIRRNNSYSDTANGITLTKSGSGYASLDYGDWMTSGDVTLNFTTATGKFTSIEIETSQIRNSGNWTKDGNTLKWNGTPSNSVSLSGSGLYLKGVSSVNFVIEMPTVSVTITPGSNMTKTTDSGAAEQTGLTGPMTDVVYTANTGYKFPDTSDAYTTTNGIAVTRTSDTVLTVSGTPTADTSITIPDAVSATVAVTGVGLDQSALSLTVGGATETLTANVQPDGATDKTVTWTTSDASVATVSGGVVTPVGAGTATITATATNGTEDTGDDKTATCAVTVTNPTAAATASGFTGAYDGTAHGITVIVTMPESGATIKYGTTEGTYDLDASPTITNVSESPLTVYYQVTADGYDPATGSATVTISKADQTHPAAPTEESVSATSVTLTAIPNGEYSMDGANWQTSPTFTGLTMNTGYTFYQRLAADANHNASPASSAASISTLNHVHNWSYEAHGATITATCANTDGGHDGETTATLTIAAPEHSVYGDGKSAEATITGSIDGVATPAIEYVKLNETLTAAPTDAGEYVAQITLGEATAHVDYTIAKADITPTVSIEGWTYGDEAKTPSVSGNTDNGTVTYTYAAKGSTDFSATVPTNAGEYTVKATVAATNNYNGGEATADFTIAKKAATVTADGKTKVFGESNPALTATATGLVGSDTLNYTLSRAFGESAGEYAITVTLGENPNYDVTATNGIFTITKKTVTVTPDAKSKTYGDANPALTATVTGLVEGEPAVYTLERTAGEDVGQYTISVKPGENDNYVIDGKTAVLTVEPRSLTEAAVKAEPDSFDYDGQEKSTQVTVTWNGKALEAGKDYTLSGDTAAKDFGTYTVTVTGTGNFKDALTTTWNIAGKQEANTSTETDDAGRTITGAVNVSPDTPATTATVDAEFAKKLLDGTEPAGENVDVYLEVEKQGDTAVNAADKTAVENAVGKMDNTEVGMYLDLSLYKKVGNAAAEEIASVATPLTVTMTVPAAMQTAAAGYNRAFSVMASVNGVMTPVTGVSYNAATGQLTFQASQFVDATTGAAVTYALVYTDTAKGGSGMILLPYGPGSGYGLIGSAVKTGVKSANTGDTGITLYVTLLAVTALMGTALVIGKRKQRG